jgi:hypothetical protein
MRGGEAGERIAAEIVSQNSFLIPKGRCTASFERCRNHEICSAFSGPKSAAF